ncbi:cytochrome P450 oxidoreductase GliC [Phlyctema vagabunda]|uniref:Cytochrome P450 oxidoreductase GliC n=1 Tax=Phlyctema vagabunda TaxID=108571 RepID=A0ABR4PFJ9_9HELO
MRLFARGITLWLWLPRRRKGTRHQTEWIAKPPRMRQACNQCHSAKIRCSGDRIGCSRCLSSGLTCEYAVSMVGRMSKSNRRQRTNSRRANAALTTELSTSSGNSLSPPPSSTASFSSLTSFGQQDYDKVNHNTFLGDFTLLTPIESANESTTTSDIESTQLDMNFNIDQFAMFPTDSDTAAPLLAGTIPPSFDSSCGKPGQNQTADSPEEQKMKAQYPELYALSHMIVSLETFVANDEAAIDEILRINQACVAKITNILDHGQYQRCNSCPKLVLTAMELMLTLYEKAIYPRSRGRKDSSGASSTPPPTSVNNLPNLQFGVFMMDPQEKIAFGNRIICKELQRYTRVIKVLSSERQSRGDNLSYGLVHVRWLVELESRVESFIKTLQG